MKYGQRLEYAHLLARLFLDRLPEDSQPDFLLPVPLYSASLRMRGFNQSLELAKIIGKQRGIPVLQCLEKVRRTLPQSSLPYKQRSSNLKGAFIMTASVHKDAHVVILDDVVTTGSTVNEVSKVLYAQGIHQIDVWSMARTPL